VSKDIKPILADWDHDPDEIQVRIVAGDDGRDKLQMRIDLGVLQMELDGRPDGARPHGAESLLDHLEREHSRAAAASEPLTLRATDTQELMREGVQYYHRYLALFHLRRFDLVARDTARNLRLFAFIVAHATDPRDKLAFDRYRPYVTMMHARALGLQALERGEYDTALGRIDEGIAAILAFLREYDQAEENDCRELAFLRDWRHQVAEERPLGPIDRLEQQLRLAITREQFEEAARLRDQIRRLRAPVGDGGPPTG
jgi:hypothetical protein